MFNGLTRHVEYHRPTAVNARLAKEAGHWVIGNGGELDPGVDGAEGNNDSLNHTMCFMIFLAYFIMDVSELKLRMAGE